MFDRRRDRTSHNQRNQKSSTPRKYVPKVPGEVKKPLTTPPSSQAKEKVVSSVSLGTDQGQLQIAEEKALKSSESQIPMRPLKGSQRLSRSTFPHQAVSTDFNESKKETSSPVVERAGRGASASHSDVLSIRGYHQRVRFYSTAPVSRKVDPLEPIRQMAIELNSGQLSMELQERVDNLGNVSFRPDSYFEQTKDSRDCVREFFKFLLLRKEILEEIEKCIQSKQKYLSKGEEDVWPGCISFVTSTLDDKNVCFVALSRDAQGSDEKLLQLLDELAKDLNNGQKGRQSKYCYAVMMQTSKSFKGIMYELTGKTRTCAEYDFGSLLSALYEEFGKRLKVDGCVNAFLFNYEKETEIQYKKDMRGRTMATVTVRDNYNSSVKKRTNNNELAIQGNQKVTLIPCCSVCQHNKSSFLATLISFQEEGEKFRQIQRGSDILQEIETASERVSVSEKKSKRLSIGINDLKGTSMNGFLTSINSSLMLKQEEDDESQAIPVYS
ncbi:hypothetical protein [Legionella maceachernii]|uniref:Uncharacterized protein n=1 Tax=Legionella maceachernii TaxID=466 RepID=A0A0W0VW54_9GAMM|nr:hypothetical protein [Legionella maceachernii]KTD24411.1 hypothetical protein Lmac_2498 [Legionella maceachernii]SJZ67442.1 hypothetical protein SAMN02745128_00735 [Legionella maceachernii]SUP02057.1 Uncharacterised protein [Legionella maceachernii]